jgi:hypothetical protein
MPGNGGAGAGGRLRYRQRAISLNSVSAVAGPGVCSGAGGLTARGEGLVCHPSSSSSGQELTAAGECARGSASPLETSDF